jgi:hypothetical protein
MTTEGGWVELSEGDEFAGYRIERSLGRGGMGMLYLALEPGLERRVALKLIAPEAASDEVFARRFAEESRIAAAIEHPNVVPIYAAGEEDGVPFIAMRYVAGSDLGRRLGREGLLEPALAVDLIAQVGNGLDAIHAAGLVHRDVKPANVLLGGAGADDHAYITDFGVARNVATESGLTQTGHFVGTLDYVAPEQISGGAVDARVDVYALGCLLFKLLTGAVPFPRDDDAARLYAHLNDPPPAPSLHATEVPAALDEVVERAMSKRPDDRYPSAGDLGRAARAALAGERPALPERTVATGAAATREIAATVPPAPAATAATVRIEADAEEEKGDPGGRRVALAVGLALLAAIAVAVTVFAAGGGDGDGGGRSTNPGGGSGTKAISDNPAAPSLTPAQLRKKADEICADSQETYKGIFSASGEESPDTAYSQALVGISSRAVGRFRALEPPARLAAPYRQYVRAQERVKDYDREALEAAEAGDATAYLDARERRDAEAPERYELARALGLRRCSPNPESTPSPRKGDR